MATEEEVKLAKELQELEKESRSSLNAKVELAKKINSLNEEQLTTLLQRNDLNEKLVARLEQTIGSLKKSVDLLKTQKKDAEDLVILLNKQVDALDQGYKKTILTEEKLKAVKEARQAEIAYLREQAKTLDGITEKEAEHLAHLEELDSRLSNFGNNASDIAQGLFSGDASGIQGALKGISNTMKGELSDSIQKTIQGSESLGAGLQAAGKKMGALALISLIESMGKLAVELGDAENAFMKSTGASQEFARSLSVTYEEGRKFTATAADMGAAMGALYNTFTDFSTIQDTEVRNSLIKTTAVLEKFGVSNQQTAQGIQTLTKGMGMSAEAAGAEMLNMVGFAQELGVAPEALAGQFGEASDSLMKLGENGDEAFRDLAAAAKVTGLSVSKLLNIVNQFDTFEGAARQAGKLNAALGGNFVNAMDLMMETDPTARFEMIRDSILDTGLSFDTMSYYQKNFYKDALGLDSIGDLALTLSGNMDSVSDETKKTTKDFEEAAKEAKTLASFQEQLNAVFAQMIPILTPLIDAFRGLLTFMSDNAGVMKVLGGALIGFALGGPIGAAVGGILMLMDSIKLGSEKLSALGLILEGLFLPFTALFDMIKFISDQFHEFTGSMDGALNIGEELIPIFKGIGFVLGVVILFPLLKVLTGVKLAIVVFGLFAGAVKGLMGAFAEKNSPSFFDMFTGGMLEKAFDALMTPFRKFEAVISYIGDIFKTIVEAAVAFFNALTDPGAAANIEKIAAAIENVSRTKALALGSAMSDVGIAIKAQSEVASNDVMNKTMATTAAAIPAAAARAAAPTAANTNIAQNSSSNTYINSGPENAVIDVRIGDEKLGRVVQKIQTKRAAKAIAGRT